MARIENATCRTKLKQLFLVYVGVYMAFLMGANAVILISPGSPDTNSIFVVSWLVMHAVCGAFAIVLRFKNRVNFSILIVLSYYVLSSVLWSPDPRHSFPYAVMFVGNCLFSYLVFSNISLRDFLRIWRIVIILMIVLGLLLYFSGYKKVVYIDAHERSNIFGLEPLRGLFSHKIRASLYAVVGLVITLSLKSIRCRYSTSLLLLVFVLFTGSSTGISLGVFIFVVFLLSQVLRRLKITFGLAIVFCFLVVFPAGSLLYANFEAILTALGRDLTLTGRTYLWSWGIEAWQKKPIIGWGFVGYFQSKDAVREVASIASFSNYDVPHFHQSFIQTAADLGGVGVLFLLVFVAYVLKGSYVRGVFQGESEYLCVFLILLVLLVASTTMVLFFDYNHACTVFLIVSLFYLVGLHRRNEYRLSSDKGFSGR